MSTSSVEATRELCDDLDSLIEFAKQGHAPIRAVCLIERARGDLQAYLDEIDLTGGEQRLVGVELRAKK
jgi:hypothetical protein